MTPIQQAIETLEFFWRDVSMNDYAFEKLETTLAALRAQPASLPRLNEAQIDRILGCLDPSDGGFSEIEKFLGDYLRAQLDHSELVKNLRLGASISRERRLNLDFAKIADEAADALEGKV